jgi:hypothetical protein
MNKFAKLLLAASISAALAGCPTTPPAPPVTHTPPTSAPPPPPEPPVVVTPVPPPPAEPSASEVALATGVAAYERGGTNNLREAIRILTPIATTDGSLETTQRLRALKFLAFSHCSLPGAAAKTACRETFERAFRVSPSFDLAPAERGHPDWDPAFQQARRTVLGR